jgi:hypothetical protein
VTELVRGRREHGLRLEDLLTVVLFLHSALDTREQFPQEEEERLRAVLGEAILRCRRCKAEQSKNTVLIHSQQR